MKECRASSNGGGGGGGDAEMRAPGYNLLFIAGLRGADQECPSPACDRLAWPYPQQHQPKFEAARSRRIKIHLNATRKNFFSLENADPDFFFLFHESSRQRNSAGMTSSRVSLRGLNKVGWKKRRNCITCS